MLAALELFDQRDALSARRSAPREPAAGVMKRALVHA
jgi:hypothetical protein